MSVSISNKTHYFCTRTNDFHHQPFSKMNIQPSVTDLVNNAARLDAKEFESLFKKLAILRLQRAGAKTLPAEESELLQMLNQGFPAEKWERLKHLDWKSEFGVLNKKEEAESLRLAEAYEEASVMRLKIMAKLADLRNISIDELAATLGIKPSYHA